MSRYKPKEKVTKRCLECGDRFLTNRDSKLYCKHQCAMKAWAKLHPRVHVDSIQA